MARYRSVSVPLSVAGQLSVCGVSVTAVSPTRRFSSARKAPGSWLGNSRTSSAAVATGGMTLVLSLPLSPVIEIVLRNSAL